MLGLQEQPEDLSNFLMEPLLSAMKIEALRSGKRVAKLKAMLVVHVVRFSDEAYIQVYIC